MPVVRFHPLEKSSQVGEGSTLLSAALRSDIPLGQSCSGDGICGWCKVRILEGGKNLLPPGPLELRLKESARFAEDERAACLAKVMGDVTVTTGYW